jgi:two-component system, OmpR family, sensor histidine kinase CiaH
MITELRKKFIAIAMLSLLGTMAVLCVAIGIGNYCITTNRADKAIEILYQNDGTFPVPDEDVSPSLHGGFQVTPETPFETRYFIAHISADGTVNKVELDHIAAFDAETVMSTIEEIQGQAKARGYADYYRFGSFKSVDGGQTLVVLDCFVQQQSAYSIIRVIAGIFVLCAGIVFVLLLILSERMTRPFVRNWENQRRFVTDASHELKTPLAILSADLGLIEEDEDNRPWLDGAREQITRMDGLIRNLVELARSEEALPASAVTSVCVSDVAASVAENFKPLAQSAGKMLVSDITPNLTISGVKDDINRLISLLLDNAVKYCDDGGTISLTASKKGKNVLIEVSNPCAGLDVSQLSHYFDRFYRADSSRARATGGTGIGLSTAKAIVTRHRGRISDRYEDGVIAFTIMLPAEKQS